MQNDPSTADKPMSMLAYAIERLDRSRTPKASPGFRKKCDADMTLGAMTRSNGHRGPR